MIIGPIEIRLAKDAVIPQSAFHIPHSLDAAGVRGALAVGDTVPLWVAVHQVIDAAEQAANELAQDSSFEPNECVVNAAAAKAMRALRKRLNDLRAEGIRGNAEFGMRNSELQRTPLP